MRVITQASVAAGGTEVKAASGYDGLTKQSGMISLDLPAGTVEAPPGGVDDSHVTVIFLGDALTPEDFDQACGRAQDAASRIPGPLSVSLSGIAAFPPNENGKKAVYVPASVPGGDRLHNDLSDLSASQFKTWIPHATSHFDDADAPMPAPHPHKVVTVTHLSVHRGDEVRRFPFGGGETQSKEMDMSTPIGTEQKVGPKGYEHGWRFVGVPGVGEHVHHPSFGKGKVTAATGTHLSVRFNNGSEQHFARRAEPAKRATRDGRALKAPDGHAQAVAKAKSVHEAEKARGAGHLHPLAKTGPAVTDAKGTTRSTAVDHEGREFRLKANGDKVTVKHDGKSMSSTEKRNPSLMAREMAGKLAGTGAAPKAREPDAGKPLAPGLSQSYVTGKGATGADVAELTRRYRIMHGKDPSAKMLSRIKRAKPETAKPAAGKPMPHHAATAHAIADDVRTERGLRPFQKEEAETRLRSAGRNLSAGNHDEAVADLGDATRAAGTPGGGVIKGSVAARSRDLAGQVRTEAAPKGPEAGAVTAPGPHPADRLTRASNPKATAKAMSTDELAAADTELGRRAALLGKPGQVSSLHKTVRAELQQRGAAKSPGEPSALHGDAAFEHVPEPVGKKDRDAVHAYTSGFNYRYNQPLRSGAKVTDANDAKQLRALDSAFANAKPTMRHVTVHRGLAGNLFGDGDATGTEFTDKGFSSTSTDAGQAAEFGPEHGGALMEIHVPAGSKVVKPGSTSREEYQGEKEIVLNRGGKYKITGDTMINHPKYGRMRKLTATYLGSE